MDNAPIDRPRQAVHGIHPLRVAPGAAQIASWCLLALIIVNVVLLVHYVAFEYRLYFHSDAALKNLIVDEIRETGRFFPPGWNHVNGDLLVVFGHLVVLPLSLLFHDGFALHAASVMVTSAVVLWVAWLLAGMVTRVLWEQLVYLAIVSAGISGIVVESLYGQVSYGTVFYLGGLILYSAWRMLVAATPRAVGGWAAALALLTLLAYWSNPQRAVASYTLPLLAGLAVHALAEDMQARRWWSGQARRATQATTATLAGAVVGTVLHRWVLAGVNNQPGAGHARWLPFNQMADNLLFTLQGLLGLLGALPETGRVVTSAAGGYEALRLLGAVMLLAVLPVALARCLLAPRAGLRLVAAFASVSLVLFLFLHVTTTIPDMTDPVNSARYLVPAVLVSLPPLLVATVSGRLGPLPRMAGGLALVLLATSAFAPSNPLGAALVNDPVDPRAALLNTLERQGLHYGYASYWNAGALTVLSDGRVKVRQVLPDNGLLVPMRHLSSDRWYEPAAWRGPTFLLLTDAEYAQVDWPSMARYAGKPVRRLRVGDMNVVVFPRNVADVLPNWSRDPARPLQVRMGPESHHVIGSFVSDPTGGHLAAVAGEAGFLHFGPYLKLAPGRYRATFDLATTVAGAAVVDVTSAQSSVVHGTRPVSGTGRQQVAVDFDATAGIADLELRVATNGAGQVALYGITVRQR